LARYYQKTNTHTHTPDGDEPITVAIAGGTTTVPVRYRGTLSHTQVPIDIVYKPLVYKFEVDAGVSDTGTPLTAVSVVKTSFENSLTYFKNAEFNEALGLEISTKDVPYKSLYKMYKSNANRDPENIKDPNSPIIDLLSLRYGEVVYPSRDYMYTETVRGRTSYQNNFWRDNRTDRTTLGLSKKPRNAATASVTQSAWALDAQEDFLTLDVGQLSGGLGFSNTSGRRCGELQNEYVHCHAHTASEAQPGILYSRKQIYPLSASITPFWGMDRIAAAETTIRQPPLMRLKSLFRGEALWEAGTKAGRYEGTSSNFVVSAVNPFADDYDTFFGEIKGKGQAYTIIPEFRISEHLDYYNQNGLDFLVENQKLFEIPGTPTGSTLPQNSAEDNFYTTYSNSDFLKYFEVIKDDHAKIDNTEPIEPHTITLRCKAIKKFIPYDGFYPAERTIQMANKFITEYSGGLQYISTDSTGFPKQALRTLLKPLFAPGILYNTIKSGIAVDYPILTSSFYPNWPTYTGSVDYYGNQLEWQQFSHSASCAIFGSSRQSGSAYPDAQGNVDHSLGWDDRLPFETILEPERYLADKTISDDEPSPVASIESVVAWSGDGDTEYKKMMNNFLAETVNTFLYKSELSAVESLPQKEWKDVTPGTPYGMRVKMWRSMDKGRVASGSWGNFPLPQNVPVVRTPTKDDAAWSAWPTAVNPFDGSALALGENVTPQETFTMYSRPSAFGPPLGLFAATGTTAADKIYVAGDLGNDYSQVNVHQYEFAPENGVFASHTPPYYDGECWFDIIYWPKGLETNPPGTGPVAEEPIFFRFKSDSTGEPYRPSFGEIWADTHPSIFAARPVPDPTGTGRHPQYPLQGSYKRKWRYDPHVFVNEVATKTSIHNLDTCTFSGTTTLGAKRGDSTNGKVHASHTTPDQVINGTTGKIVRRGPAGALWVNEWAMQLDASLDIFMKSVDVGNDADRTWKIQTKFETPMLNFNHVAAGDGTLTLPDSLNAAQTVPRGMWHQFGRVPRGGEGVYIQVTDIPKQWLDNHPSSSLKWDLKGISGTGNKSLYAAMGDLDTYYNKYSVPIVGSGSTHNIPKVQSLVDICGFNTAPVRVGKLKQKKKLFEAVVAVPFRLLDGEKKFFGCMGPSDSLYDEFAGHNVKKLERMINKYVFPPTFDFVNNEDINPIAMYVFEFSHTLDKDDLSHIWQNLPPKLGTKAELSVATVSHRLLATELLGDARYTDPDRGTAKDQVFTGAGLDGEIRWMVFKVKMRAASDYNFQTGKSIINNMPFYTYNWPHDYFSMVELVQLEANIEFRHIPEDKKADPESLTETETELEIAGIAIKPNIGSFDPGSNPTGARSLIDK